VGSLHFIPIKESFKKKKKPIEECSYVERSSIDYHVPQEGAF